MLDRINKQLRRYGFALHWLKERDKAPVGADWSTKKVASLDRLESTYRDGYNIGVRLGTPSMTEDGWLYVIDLDINDPDEADDAWAKLEELFPDVDLHKLPCVQSGSGGESRHLYLVSDGEFASRKLAHSGRKIEASDGEGGVKKKCSWEIEFFGTGKQVAMPPSIHPVSGKPYRWEREFDLTGKPPSVHPDIIERIVGRRRTDDDLFDDVDQPRMNLSDDEIWDILRQLEHYREDRFEWCRVGMALHHECGDKKGWHIFDEWSDGGSGYNLKKNRVQWDSFSRRYSGRRLSMRSLLRDVDDIHRANIADEFDDIVDDPSAADDDPPPILRADIIRLFDEMDQEDGTLDRETERRRKGIAHVPPHLLTIPGVLGLAVDHYNQTSVQYQPEFAVATVLGLASVTLGRHHKLVWEGQGSFTSLYLTVIGDSGSGKEYSRGFIREVLKECKMMFLLEDEGYASLPGLIGALLAQPRHILIEDEIGMKRTTQSKSPDSNQEHISRKLISLWGDLGGVARLPKYSINGKSAQQIEEERKRFVNRPAISAISMTVEDSFFDSLSQASILDGSLNRYIIVRSRLGMGEPTGNRWFPMPKKLREWFIDYGHTDDMHHQRERLEDVLGTEVREEPVNIGDPKEFNLTKEAEKLAVIVRRKFIELKDQYKSRQLGDLFVRSYEKTLRLALIVALSCDSRKVARSHLQWAYDYMLFRELDMAVIARDKIGSSPMVRTAEKIAEAVEDAGSSGLTPYEMGRVNHVFRKSTSTDRKEIFYLLTNDHNISEVVPKRGRRTIRYIHNCYRKENADD